jgi:hypothetical protein
MYVPLIIKTFEILVQDQNSILQEEFVQQIVDIATTNLNKYHIQVKQTNQGCSTHCSETGPGRMPE